MERGTMFTTSCYRQVYHVTESAIRIDRSMPLPGRSYRAYEDSRGISASMHDYDNPYRKMLLHCAARQGSDPTWRVSSQPGDSS